MARQKRSFATWATNLPSYNQYNLSKKKKIEQPVSEGGEDKENIPEPEHAEGFSDLFLPSPPIHRRPREISQAIIGRSPRKELERTDAPVVNQILALAVSNLSNGLSWNVIPYLVPAIHGSSSQKGLNCDL